MGIWNSASKIKELPILKKMAPAADQLPPDHIQKKYLDSQNLAMSAAKEVASLLQPGWTEKRAAQMMETFLKDHQVDGFFHYPFAWWGDRSRFEGVKQVYNYLPSNRVLRENEAFILDVAPIVDGYISDIGYSGFLGEPTDEWLEGQEFLKQIRQKIPLLFKEEQKGSEIWKAVDKEILESGFENIHEKYPFSVLGHRVHQVPKGGQGIKAVHFGWQSYFSFSLRGIFGQLLNQNFSGSLDGLWAIEPHIGASDFGAKFEEILVVDGDEAQWLGDKYESR